MIFKCSYCGEFLQVKNEVVVSCDCSGSSNASLANKESRKQWNLERGNKLNEYRKGRRKRSNYRK